MNPYKLSQVYKQLTSQNSILKKYLKLGTKELKQPDLPAFVEQQNMFNRFMRDNPRPDQLGRKDMAGGGMLVQPSADGSRPGYNGNIGQKKVSKGVSESSKKINKNINKWATNWFNKNQKNYGVRDFEKMKNDFATAWSKELTENSKKYEGYGSTKKTLKMSDSGLPIIKDGISIDGIKFVTRADRAGNNPDLAWERLFYKNKLKNKDFKTQLKQYVEWATANKKKNPNLLDPNVKFGSAAQSKIGTLEYGKKFKGFNDDVIFFMGDVLNKKSLNPGGTITGVTDVFKKTLGKDADNYFKKFKGSWNIWVDNFKAVGKLAGLDDSMIDALLKKQTSDTQKIMKLYNVENLPLEFKVAQDHLFGLAEAKALGDPKIAAQTLKNLVASTREQNRVLGQEGFSNKRVSLIKKFKNANLENKANIINQLNTLAEEYVPGRLKYDVKKDGSLKITNLQPETTLKAKKEAYKKVTETFPEEIKKLLASMGGGSCAVQFGPKKRDGGRIGYKVGTKGIDQCADEAVQLINSGMKNANSTQLKNFAAFANRAKNLGRNVMKFGIIPEAMYVAADATIRLAMGDKPIEALLRASNYVLPGDQTKLAEMMEATRLSSPETAAIIGRSIDYKNQLAKIQDLENQISNLDNLSDVGEFDYMGDLTGEINTKKNLLSQAKNDLNNKFKMTDAEQIYANRMQDEIDDMRGANSFLTKIKSAFRDVDPSSDIETLAAPEVTQEQLNLKMAPQLPRDLLLAPESELLGYAKYQQSQGFKIPDDYYVQQQKDIKNMSLAELAAATSPEQVYGASGTMGEPVNIDLNLYQPSDRFGSGFQERPILYPEGRNTLAGGGIAKEAGVDSGPPPESGPNPQGLSYLMKRVKNI